MAGPFDSESEAGKLRKALASHSLAPDTKLLFGATFLASLRETNVPPEVYLREFFPSLAALAAHLTRECFLPREQAVIAEMVALAEDNLANYDCAAEIESLKHLLPGIGSDAVELPPMEPVDLADDSVTVDCFFVEDHPELKFASRGRLLQLRATGLILPKATADDILFVNPLEQPEDPFLGQARASVAAARGLLEREYGLSSGQYFQIKFAINSTGARFTGDSLGAAFAVAAVALLTRLAAMRHTFIIPSTTSFTGALNPDGRIETISLAGLKLKIERAYFSRVTCLAVPREHCTEAQQYLAGLMSDYPGKHLELIGVSSLSEALDNPRLIDRRPVSYPVYLSRRILGAVRQKVIEIPLLIAFVVFLFVLIAPSRWMPWFDDNPSTVDVHIQSGTISVRNAAGDSLWSITPTCPIADSANQASLVVVSDLDHDTRNEVLFMINAKSTCPERNRLYCFESTGDTLFVQDCVVPGQYPNDTAGVQYDSEHLTVFRVDGQITIVTNIFVSNPARSHMRFWSAKGDSLGWYINAGCCWPIVVTDHDQDGQEELLALCYNNRLNRASLLAIEPLGARGCSPPYHDSSLDLSWIEHGSQVAYLAFWYTDIGRRLSPLPYNQPSPEGIHTTDSAFLVAVIAEGPWKGVSADLLYYIDRTYRVKRVIPNDCFNQARRELIANGETLSGLTVDDYLDSVWYWRDSSWISGGELKDSASHTP